MLNDRQSKFKESVKSKEEDNEEEEEKEICKFHPHNNGKTYIT